MNNKFILKKCNICEKCSNGFIGSGILLYEKNIYNKKTFIIGIDYKNELTDFGGKINNNKEKVYITASRECNEETKEIINLTPSDIIGSDYIDIIQNKHKYRCYIYKTNFFDLNKFNSKKIKNNNHEHNEIISIIKINEDELKKIYNLTQSNDCTETSQYFISTRLIKILKIFYSKNDI
jgi:hypothetical protein